LLEAKEKEELGGGGAKHPALFWRISIIL